MAGTLGSLVVSITTDLSAFNAGLKEANLKIQRTSGEILRATSQIGRQMTIMGAAITAGIGLAVKSSIDFEDAFAGVRKTVDATEEEFGQISSRFRQLAKEIPITAVEFSKIGEIAGQLGIRGVDNITKFSKTISLIGVTTNLSTEEAATSFARITNIMKEPIQNVDRLGAAIVDLGNNFAANEAEITNFANRIASAGKIIGMTTSDILGIGAAFTSVGVPAEAGGTAVQKVMNAITQAAAEGGEKLKIFAKVTGMTADEFRRLKEENPAEVFTRFVEGLGSAGDQAFAVLEELGLQNERVIRAFLSMASSSDTLRSAISTSSDAWEENLALQIEADKRFATTASQLKILMNNIVELGQQIGDALMPVLKPMLEDFKEWIQKVGNFVKENPGLTAAITKIVAGFGLLMLTLGPILMVLPGLVMSFTLLAPVLTSISVGVTTLAAAVLGFKVSLGGLVGIAAAAFAGWKIGRLIGEVTGLDEALSGENGLFTKMWGWLIKNEEKAKAILRTITAISTFGLSEAFGFGKKLGAGGPKTAEAAEIPSAAGSPASSSTTVVAPNAAEAVSEVSAAFTDLNNKVDQHVEKLNSLNEQYIVGSINAQQYYEGVLQLHQDGLSIKQEELELLQQSIELEQFATSAEEQKIFVANQGIQAAQAWHQARAEAANADQMATMSTVQSMTELQQTINSMKPTWGAFFDFINTGVKTFSKGFSTAISSMILGTKTASQAFADFGKQMVTAIVDFVVQWAVQALIAMTIGKMIEAMVGSMAGSMAAMWGPAATLASIATFGGAAAAGTAAVAGALATSAGMVGAASAAVPVFKAAEGGIFTKPSLTWIAEKEPEAAIPLSKLGNQGGGNPINITVNAKIDSTLDIADLAEELGGFIKQELRTA